jgi:hypothetical protein
MAFGTAHHMPAQSRRAAVPQPLGRLPLLRGKRMRASELVEVLLEDGLDGCRHMYI